MTVLGFDLSRGEDDPKDLRRVNFNKARANGISFAYFRFADGLLTDTVAQQFVTDCTGLMPWGSYGVIYPNASAKVQAQNYIRIINKLGLGQLPLCVDWEVEGVTWQMVDEYVANLEQAFPGKEIIIYSRAEYLKRMLPGLIKYPAKYYRFSRLAIWQAQYANVPDDLPFGFTRILWQYTDRADALRYGIEEAKSVDLNKYNGTIVDFNKRFKVSLPTEVPPVNPPPVVVTPPPVIIPPSDDGVITTDTLNIRNGPGVQYAIVGRLVKGNKVTILDTFTTVTGDVWANVAQNAWACMQIKSIAPYIVRIENPEPISDPQPVIAIYRVKHDAELPMALRLPRSLGWKPGQKLRGLPETVRLNGGKGQVELLPAWVDFIKNNNSPDAFQYVQKLRSGWENTGGWPNVEELTFGGNYVQVTRIEGSKAFIKVMSNSETPPTNPSLIQLQRFSVVYNDGHSVMGTDTKVGMVYTALVVRPEEVDKIWIDLVYLEKR